MSGQYDFTKIILNRYLMDLQAEGYYSKFMYALKIIYSAAKSSENVDVINDITMLQGMSAIDTFEGISLKDFLARINKLEILPPYISIVNDLQVIYERIEKYRLIKEESLKKYKDIIENDICTDTIIFGDKHGRADGLELILSIVREYDKKGKKLNVISLGDNFDRGNQNFKTFKLLQELRMIANANPNINFILCLGNHDIMLIQSFLLNQSHIYKMWYTQGGKEFLKELSNNKEYIKKIALWVLENSVLFHIDERNFLYIHAGIPADDEGIPLISMDKIGEFQIELESIQAEISSCESFFNHENNCIRILNFIEAANDLMWIRTDAWICKMINKGNINSYFEIENDHKLKLFEIINYNYKKRNPKINSNRIEKIVSAYWPNVLFRNQEKFKAAGIKFKFVKSNAEAYPNKLNLFLSLLGINGFVFGHEHFLSILDIDHKIFCIDVDDGDAGFLIFNKNGIWFNPKNRKELEQIATKQEILMGL
ncbi:MAG: metallophosphoesterase [Desulfobacterales bacterium]|nr:metallophosphoesterase [Desulfobacterales bacterium]